MHTAAIQLAPVLAAEHSKVPFYIAGGALVLWALVVSLLLGMRKPDFPGSLGGQRIVSAITVVLVLAAMSTAVITSGGSAKPAQASTGTQTATTPEGAPAPAATTPAETATAPATQTARTGTSVATPKPAPPAAHSELKLAADASGQLLFIPKQLRAKAGTVTIKFSNSSPLEHNLTVAQGSSVLGATPTFAGGSKPLTLTLKAGTYTFYCTVPGHRQAGMEGTLTVT
jgi:plastocyanin